MKIYYTDGSCSPNPGPGGFAVILVESSGMRPVILGQEPDTPNQTTNIRMEGWALVKALEHSQKQKAQIYTDSEFWINVMTKWAPGWRTKGWKKSKGQIKNLDLVQKLLPLYEASQAELIWVKGHEGDPGNEMADDYANRARAGEQLTSD